MCNRKVRLNLVLFLAGSISSIGWSEPLNFQTIDLPCAGFTTVMGVNDAGDVVGYSDLGSFVETNGAFLPVAVPGGVNTRASDINNLGQIAGFAAFPDPGTGFRLRGFIETNGMFTLLNTPNLLNPNVEGLNDLGQVVGAESNDTRYGSFGFLYSDGVATTIDYPGSIATFFTAINNSGQIVGQAALGGGLGIGLLYDHGIFTPIQYPGAVSTFLTGINDSGQIVGWYHLPTDLEFSFLYDHGVFTPITDPDAAPRYLTTPTGINNLGQIAGYFTDDSNRTHGFLATPVPEAGPRPLLSVGLLVLAFIRGDRPMGAYNSWRIHIRSREDSQQ